MKRLVVMAVLMGALLAPAAASAHQQPGELQRERVKRLDRRDRTSGIYANGETITYTVSVSNDRPVRQRVRRRRRRRSSSTSQPPTVRPHGTDGDARDAASALPGGQPGAGHRAPCPYTPRGQRGRGRHAARGSTIAAGMLHDIAGVDDPLGDLKTIGTAVVEPTITIDKNGSTDAGRGAAERHLHLRRHATRAGRRSRSTRSWSRTTSAPTRVYASGDNGDRHALAERDVDFTCSMLHQTAGVYMNTAQGVRDQRARRHRRCARSPTRGRSR